MVYVSNFLRYRRRVDLEKARFESIWIEIKFKSENILVCCFYRSDFNVSQALFIELALDYSSDIILTGDINIDFTNLTNVQLRDCLALFNLTNVIDEPTKITDYSSSLIDPIPVSDACSVLDSGVIPVENAISDYKATYVSIKAP